MKPIRLDFKPSKILSLLLSAMSIGGLSIVMLLTLPWLIKLVLGLMIIVSACHAICKHGLLLLPSSCIAVEINSKNELELLRKDDKALQVTVIPNSVVTPYLTVFNSQQIDASWQQRFFVQHVIIFNDAVDAEQYRQFRVWLRWGYTRKD